VSQYSYHVDRFYSALFASLWVNAWGDRYPVKVAPFSSCTTELLAELENRLGVNAGDVLVDLGCGAGGVGLWLAENQSLRLIGLDRCSDATTLATTRAGEWNLAHPADFVTADFNETGLESASADAVFSVDAFTAAADIQLALTEVKRILKPNGVFVFTARQLTPTGRHFEALGGDWEKGLEEHGFSAISMTTRTGVSALWQSIFNQWLEHEADLRRELQPETVDALVAEARNQLPQMNDERPWLLISATTMSLMASDHGFYLQSASDALDVIGSGQARCIFTETDFVPGFFDLRNGIAGEVFQKFVNYNFQAAFIVPPQHRYGERVSELIKDHRSHANVRLFHTVEEAELWFC